ncbi:MAG TPA: ABC transporter permease [Longimicrobiaceae bacterium]
MSPAFVALRAFMVKEVWHLLRDRQTLAILLLLPLAQVVLFGYALRNDIEDVRIAFVDPSPDAASLALRARFEGTRHFRMVASAPTVQALEPLFRRGAVDLALAFPPDFAGDLASERGAALQLVGDAADPNTGSTMAAYAAAVIGDFERELGGRAPLRIETRMRMRFNPTLESVNLFVPGLIALVLTMVSALMTAISLSREKERGTMEILLVSPLRPWQIITGKVMPYLLLAFANAVTALLAAWLIFHVPFRGSLLLLLSASVLYALVGLALGVVIASVAPSQRAAMVTALAGTMLPNALLSGMIFPIASLPNWLQLITLAVPARWFIVIARGVMLKGVGLEYVWMELLILTGMLVVLILAAVRAFRPRLAV